MAPPELEPCRPEWLPDGMDPKTSFFLDMKLFGNNTRVEGGWYSTSKVVDSYDDVVKLFYLADESHVEIRTDEELLAMFAKHESSKVIRMSIGYFDTRKPHVPPPDWNISNAVISDVVPCTPSLPQNPPLKAITQGTQPTKSDSHGTQPTETTNDTLDTYLVNPFPQNEHAGDDDDDDDDDEGDHETACPTQPTPKGDYVPSSDSESGYGTDDASSDEEQQDPPQPIEPEIVYDVNDPPMVVGSIYPNMNVFKLAIAQHSIKHEFEYNTEKSDLGRFRAHCSSKSEGCPWRIHASTMQDKVTVKVKKNPDDHNCESKRRKGNMPQATQFWVCEKVKDWLVEDASIGPKELQRRIKDTHKVVVSYKRVFYGKELALKQLFGDWDTSFNNLYRFKAAVEEACPGSLVVIDHYTIEEKIRFRRLFFALKPCVNGFLRGCRPYLAADSTFLTGKFKGQLAVACAVDGHNWMYPVGLEVFDSETTENWSWFFQQLKNAIGTPPGLSICTDAGQAIMAGVAAVFPNVEHRECMVHLVSNFKKRYHGKVFDKNLWLAAYSWNSYYFNKHWHEMAEAKPAAVKYLRQNHTKLWTRSQFSTLSKVDYVTNNLAERFNNWIKSEKDRNLDDLMDVIRQKLMVKWNKRRKIARKMEGKILPHIVKNLKERSRNLDIDVLEGSDEIGEVIRRGGSGFRYAINLKERTCTCREWQVSGKPCNHAIAMITSIRGQNLEDHVDSYFSVDMFKSAYEEAIPALPDKSQWPESQHGFFMHPPLLKSTSGRRKTQRHKSSAEGGQGRKGRHQCPICKQHGHHWWTCKDGDPEDKAAMLAARGPPKSKKRKTNEPTTELSIDAPSLQSAPTMTFPPETPNELAALVTKKKRTPSSSSSIKMSGSGSNQLEPMAAIMLPTTEKATKGKRAKSKLVQDKKTAPTPQDSPAMCTRSKIDHSTPGSTALCTRSKRKLDV